jgi:quinol monooxygenase YgiN
VNITLFIHEWQIRRRKRNMSEPVAVIASFFPKAGQEQQVEQVLHDMISPTRAEPGALRYELYGGVEDSSMFVLIEMYRDHAALESHRGASHYKAFRARIDNLLTQPVQVGVLRVIDVGRLPAE